MKTYTPKASEIKREWHLINADGQVLGRLATQLAVLLQGKNKPYYAPHLDCGDFVVVINAAKIKITGDKLDKKVYYRHSGYPGGFRQMTLKEKMAKNPSEVIEKAVFGMLPDNKLKTARLIRLKVYSGEHHEYSDKFKSGAVKKTK
jgi:large subunit ribosomal protein L13